MRTRQQIAEERIGALAFDGPIGRSHESRLGNILNLAGLHVSRFRQRWSLILAVFASSALTLIIRG